MNYTTYCRSICGGVKTFPALLWARLTPPGAVGQRHRPSLPAPVTSLLPWGSPAAHLWGWFTPQKTPLFSCVRGQVTSCGLESWISSLQSQTHSRRCKEERQRVRKGRGQLGLLDYPRNLTLGFILPFSKAEFSFELSLCWYSRWLPILYRLLEVTMFCFLLWQVNQSCPVHQGENFSAAVAPSWPIGKVRKVLD